MEPSKKTQPGRQNPLLHKRRYRRLGIRSGLAFSVVAVLPLVVMTVINYHQYQEAFHQEIVRPMDRLTSNTRRTFEFLLSERLSALSMVIRDKSTQELSDPAKLRRLLAIMKKSFGGFVDLGFIDAEGRQVSYVGPYRLQGKNYQNQEWFHAVHLQDVYISEVFLGHRKFPHFVLAVREDSEKENAYVLRATIDTKMINAQIRGSHRSHHSDVFIINHQGVLQTPSRIFGEVLQKIPLTIPPESSATEVMEVHGRDNELLIVGYAYIQNSPFILMEVIRPGAQQESWLSLRRELVIFLIISVMGILAVVAWMTSYIVNRIREVDIKRATIFHKMEYTNKMAAIGRLGAGVAHEVNNPLAIIGEKAGLLKDLLTFSEELPPKEKMLALIDSVTRSVERCSTITHRLLGFAKHMDVRHDKINPRILIQDVLSFLEKEAGYRNIEVQLLSADNLPAIESDRNQLQQVFLNLINNAFAAVDDGGHIEITLQLADSDQLAVAIKDDGVGIPEEHLQHIFEPFFTTKKGYGTGLGLSITYGIVEKLGGKIKVQSKAGEGTCFTVFIPVASSYA